MSEFAKQVVKWQKQHGRHNFPWQIGRSPYSVWVSEVMLQQTQVQTVIPYYQRFMTTCPTVDSLAQLDIDTLMQLWQGLGYYSRARNLQKAAQMVMTDYNGVFPNTREDLMTLPGIGRSTAAAIMSLAYQVPDAILDGNVKRVLCRYHGVKSNPKDKYTIERLWAHAEEHLSSDDPQAYTQGIMDLGANICKRSKPVCSLCPLHESCYAHEHQMTHDIPAKSPKVKAKPKDLFVIMCLKDTQLGLVRRSQSIWAGLYTPLIYDNHNLLLQDFPQAKALAKYQHKLTHLNLTIYPFVATVKSCDKITHWQDISDITAAIPTGMIPAIKQLYACIQEDSDIS